MDDNYAYDELTRGDVMVQLEYIGEGYVGEYDPSDPNDVPLLRFYVRKRVDDPNDPDGWEDVDDASYCTLLPSTISDEVRQACLTYIMDRVYEPLMSGGSIKHICAELSWIEPSWVTG
jgi:hypothetical protein